MMTRSAKADHSALLLEGWDDQRFYRNLFAFKVLVFRIRRQKRGRGYVIHFDERGQGGVAGVIDADCDHFKENELSQERLALRFQGPRVLLGEY